MIRARHTYDSLVRVLRCLVVAGVLTLPTLAVAAPSPTITVTITARTHLPKLIVKWPYELRVTGAGGRPLKALLTMNVLDPFGGVHPVQLGDTTRVISRLPIVGVFRDFMRWPPDSKGFKLTVRATVRVGTVTRVATYVVQPGP